MITPSRVIAITQQRFEAYGNLPDPRQARRRDAIVPLELGREICSRFNQTVSLEGALINVYLASHDDDHYSYFNIDDAIQWMDLSGFTMKGNHKEIQATIDGFWNREPGKISQEHIRLMSLSRIFRSTLTGEINSDQYDEEINRRLSDEALLDKQRFCLKDQSYGHLLQLVNGEAARRGLASVR